MGRKKLMHLRVVAWFLFIGIVLDSSARAQNVVTVFQGLPTIKISEGGNERVPETVPRKQAVDLVCTVSKIGDKYYWTSRENKILRRVESGAFTTFLAEDGSGYVRIVTDSADRKLFKFAYVEHLLIMLNSVTYYGSAR